MVLWLSVRCLAPILEPLYLITRLSSALAYMYHEFRKIIEFRHMKVFRTWSGNVLLRWDLRSSYAVLNSLLCWSRVTAVCDLTLSLPTPCGMKNHLRGLFTTAAHESWFIINIQRTSRGVPVQYRIFRGEGIALGLRKQPFCLAKDLEVLKFICFLVGNDSRAF